jgi:hypothetical protein
MEGANIGHLLLTGEPEAVAAVVHSPALTDELARYAWWAQPSIENARLMLSREKVARGTMGPVLADFLVEHLPFLQDEHLEIMDTVVVLLNSRALSEANRETIWKRGRKSNSHYVGFLEVAGWDDPQALPCQLDARPLPASTFSAAETALLQRVLDGQGQTFLAAAAEVLEKPETQDVVNRTLNAIGRYFGRSVVLAEITGDDALVAAAARVAAVSQARVDPVFARTTAIGSLMRRKIEPVVSPLLADIRLLRAIRP